MIDLKKKINVCEPLITKNAKKYINDCIDTEWISSAGKYLEDFEKKWAKYCGADYAVTRLLQLGQFMQLNK